MGRRPLVPAVTFLLPQDTCDPSQLCSFRMDVLERLDETGWESRPLNPKFRQEIIDGWDQCLNAKR